MDAAAGDRTDIRPLNRFCNLNTSDVRGPQCPSRPAHPPETRTSALRSVFTQLRGGCGGGGRGRPEGPPRATCRPGPPWRSGRRHPPGGMRVVSMPPPAGQRRRGPERPGPCPRPRRAVASLLPRPAARLPRRRRWPAPLRAHVGAAAWALCPGFCCRCVGSRLLGPGTCRESPSYPSFTI